MTEWFDELKANYPYMANEIFDKGFNKYLEKEKEQIVEAFEQGLEFGFPTNGSNYFDKTYNQNK